ncbi:hypothetical protein [Streptomyces mobaraensis]|uniref:hypothetical protein n=1 Tax=Streptomyces mobaraensis TaxID=35621 RepID=UPI0033C1FEA8
MALQFSDNDFEIQPEDVAKAGEAAHRVAKAMPDGIKGLYKPCDSAVAGLQGTQTGKAVHECMEAWAKALRALAGRVETAGDKITTSAKESKGVDEKHALDFIKRSGAR